MRKKETKTKIRWLRLRPSTDNLVLAEAEKEERSLAWMLNRLVVEALEHRGALKKR